MVEIRANQRRQTLSNAAKTGKTDDVDPHIVVCGVVTREERSNVRR